MRQYENNAKLVDPTSPARLALYSYGIFLVAWILPPTLYTTILYEPDLMFLNPVLFAFFTICTAAFIAGLHLAEWLTKTQQLTKHVPEFRASVMVLCVPVAVATLWAVAYLRDVGTHLSIAALLLSQQGSVIKDSNSSLDLSSGRLALSEPFLIACLWWSYSRYSAFKRFLVGRRLLFIVVFSTGFLVAMLICLSLVDRSTLMPLVIGTMLLWVHYKYRSGSLNRKSLAVIGLVVIGLIGCLFAFFSYLRGSNSSAMVLGTIAGYSIASYNRLAAVLSGLIVSPFPGKPIHLVYYLLESVRLEGILHFRAALSWPDAYGVFLLEFTQIYASGLNPSLIWLGFFGYIFTDIGWLTPLYIGVVGVVTGLVWASFRRQHLIGLILYPWLGFCILFWMGSSIEFNQTFVYLAEAVGAIWLYERMFFRPAIIDALD